MSVDLDGIREEIAVERREFDRSERAPYEGRLANREEWLAALARRRARIAELEAREQELVAIEESEAELGESFDPDFSGRAA